MRRESTRRVSAWEDGVALSRYPLAHFALDVSFRFASDHPFVTVTFQDSEREMAQRFHSREVLDELTLGKGQRLATGDGPRGVGQEEA